MALRIFLAASAALAAAVAGAKLVAQQGTPDERLEEIRAAIEDSAKSRPRLAPPPIGKPPLQVDAPPVDWAEARRLVQESRRRDFRSATTAAVATAPQSTGGVRAASPSALPNLRLPEVERAEIPVLIPATARILETVQVIGQPDAYTAIAEVADGVDMRIAGSRKRLVLERPSGARASLEKMRSARPPLPGIGARYVITRSESSTDLSFSRFNVGYVLSLICDDPRNDVRCAEDDFITELASSMALLNEGAGGEE